MKQQQKPAIVICPGQLQAAVKPRFTCHTRESCMHSVVGLCRRA